MWALFAILGAVALAFVTGLIHLEEKVNGLWLARRIIDLNDEERSFA